MGVGKKDKVDSTEEYEELLCKAGKEKYILRLCVTGMSPRSIHAIENIRKICEENLKGRYELEVVDIYQQPQYVKIEHLLTVPTLIKKLPLPLRKLIGDMSDKECILSGLDLIPKKMNKVI